MDAGEDCRYDDIKSEGYIYANLCNNVSQALYVAMLQKHWRKGYALKQAHDGNMRLSDIAKTLAELGAHMEVTVKFIDAPDEMEGRER